MILLRRKKGFSEYHQVPAQASHIFHGRKEVVAMSAVRDTILNNYLQTYQPSITRYDSHKKSDLRNTYNSIVKLNKESPWYLPVTSKDTQAYAVSLKENARELRSDIAELGGLEEDGLISGKSAFSSDPDVVSALFVGDEKDSDSVPTFDIEVKSIATAQENKGNFLPDTAVDLPEATYSFDVGINGMNYEFQFSISEGETNGDVQERLARLINNSGIGLSAELVSDGSWKALKISSEATGIPKGRDEIFRITDERTSKEKGAVDYFGLGNITTAPANAHFAINGEDRETNSNRFTVGKTYEIELKGVSEEGKATTIGLKTNTETVTDNVSKLIGSYNNFLKAVSTYTNSQARSKQLAGEIKGIGSYYGNLLEGVGINIDEDGTLSVDEDKLKETAENSGDLSSTFGALKDFSNSLLRKSNQVALNPMEYVQRTVVAYKNPGHNFASPYTTSSYSGMMFNFFC